MKKIVAHILLILLIAACSSDDTPLINQPIEGVWVVNLVEIEEEQKNEEEENHSDTTESASDNGDDNEDEGSNDSENEKEVKDDNNYQEEDKRKTLNFPDENGREIMLDFRHTGELIIEERLENNNTEILYNYSYSKNSNSLEIETPDKILSANFDIRGDQIIISLSSDQEYHVKRVEATHFKVHPKPEEDDKNGVSYINFTKEWHNKDKEEGSFENPKKLNIEDGVSNKEMPTIKESDASSQFRYFIHGQQYKKYKITVSLDEAIYNLPKDWMKYLQAQVADNPDENNATEKRIKEKGESVSFSIITETGFVYLRLLTYQNNTDNEQIKYTIEVEEIEQEDDEEEDSENDENND
ncbi:hypothetical protein QA597_03595 [Marinilabiliaceae bacterium ANBcel2]|nr:hypothetical protein [Marinilabiliaceae bacterium ANBcel2]